MDIKTALRTVVTEKRDLSMQDMAAVMRSIMTGAATPAQIGGFLIGLRMKGETVEEIVAAAQVMRELATPVEVEGQHLVDTCGTGGDGVSTFNISTASAFVVAAAGGKVAKHGNRSVSSHCGSADVLEVLEVKLDLSPKQIAHCINQVGIGFLFAPHHHRAMQYAIAPRREMGVRTIFNLLGPLTNPARVVNQVIGVFNHQWVEPIAQVSKRLGSQHVLVVHSEDGLDEISIAAPTFIAELRQGKIATYSFAPEDVGIPRATLDQIQVHTVKESADMLRNVFDNQPSAARDSVILNAGAAIYAANLTDDLPAGILHAQTLLSSGSVRAKLDEFIKLTQSFT